jgi:TetR/AcrR family transcriptional repressor of nem operon
MKSSQKNQTLREQKKQTSRARIMRSASSAFRKEGVTATGVDQIMAGAHLTAGTFYSHFNSKDELLHESLTLAFSECLDHLLNKLPENKSQARQAVFKRYLSKEHVAHPESGCPIASLGPEIQRFGQGVKESTIDYMANLIAALEKIGVSRENAITEFSLAVGSLLLARIAKENGFGEEIRKLALDALLKSAK